MRCRCATAPDRSRPLALRCALEELQCHTHSPRYAVAPDGARWVLHFVISSRNRIAPGCRCHAACTAIDARATLLVACSPPRSRVVPSTPECHPALICMMFVAHRWLDVCATCCTGHDPCSVRVHAFCPHLQWSSTRLAHTALECAGWGAGGRRGIGVPAAGPLGAATCRRRTLSAPFAFCTGHARPSEPLPPR
jgi:hypothetical protein